MKLLILVFMFFVFSSLLIISNNEIYLSTDEGINEFSVRYVSWADKLWGNMVQMSGNIVKQDWFP